MEDCAGIVDYEKGIQSGFDRIGAIVMNYDSKVKFVRYADELIVKKIG